MGTAPKTDRLKIREKKLVKGLVAGLTPTAAMRAAGYSDATARGKAGKKVAESRIQLSIQELMDKQGLTNEKLLSTLGDGLKADRDDDKPDFGIRHKYLDTALKLKGSYPSDRVEVAVDFTDEKPQIDEVERKATERLQKIKGKI